MSPLFKSRGLCQHLETSISTKGFEKDLLKLALDTYSTKDEVAVKGEIARTKFKLSAVMQEAGMAAQALTEKATDEAIAGQVQNITATEKGYDKLVAYFYRY
ncbi:hypothetical protein B7494_g2453 [Chlorociboria aeruginascens]|nr:hypothetical protein B7494_g2453 [Chlorociboria aeruginascens]